MVGLLNHLAATGSVAQWMDGALPDSQYVRAIDGDEAGAPARLGSLLAGWRTAGAPRSPVGNSTPPLPGVVDPTPRYTGLAVRTVDQAGIMEALWARRGWLTSAPGLWLTLAAQRDTELIWMGGTVPPGNAVTLTIRAGRETGQPLGLALWQDDRPVQQLTSPLPPEGWTITVPAVPGSLLFAVATSPDGHFAVTAPLQVNRGGDGRVRISRVVPVPGQDYDGDGALTADDEFIELVNPGSVPVALAGWQLSDRRGDETPSKRFTFGVGRSIAGGATLRLFRPETGINLNNDADTVRLLDPAGNEIDALSWDTPLQPGTTFHQDQESGEWQEMVEYDPPPWPDAPRVVDSNTGPQGVAEKEQQERWARWPGGWSARVDCCGQAPGAQTMGRVSGGGGGTAGALQCGHLPGRSRTERARCRQRDRRAGLSQRRRMAGPGRRGYGLGEGSHPFVPG